MKSVLRWLSKRVEYSSSDEALAERPAAKEAWLRRNIGSVIAQYFVLHIRTKDVSIPFEDVTLFDGMADWVPALLDRPELSEPEFAAFQFFTDPKTTVLDIGAHWGSSVASMWRAGCAAHILSFEPNPWQQAPLRRIRELRPGRFDFLNVGLGNVFENLRFVIPVVQGIGIGALGSAAIERELATVIPDNLVNWMITYVPHISSPVLQFTETKFTVAPLDKVLESACLTVPIEQIAAIKLDVEGWEAEVIEGATETLRRHRPVLMVEGANRAPTVVDRLSALGYRYAEFSEFSDGRVYLSNEESMRVSGFFLHEARLDEYRRSGLLVAGS
jgi:FkbM family methyltransferase